ncbi:FAD-binding protein [Burkholderia seminalis]|uniref:FAD-binding protein n=1 Tax=Burkholderia seminalis TaxID=488731 RepID=UPI0031E342BA
MTQHFDAIVIGTGQAGPPLAARLSAAGMKVAIIARGSPARVPSSHPHRRTS